MEHIIHLLEAFCGALAAILGVLATVVPFIWRWTARINITYTFSQQMATNHLPHLFKVQQIIAKKLGVDIPEDPPINFVEINGKH